MIYFYSAATDSTHHTTFWIDCKDEKSLMKACRLHLKDYEPDAYILIKREDERRAIFKRTHKEIYWN